MLYRIYTGAMGYLVYRHCFDEAKCGLRDGALAHRVALFVTKDEAEDYCAYRNRLTEQNGSDALPAHADDGG
jgi:hypothetical protein